MTPLRECVLLLLGSHTIVFTVKDENADIEEHVGKVLLDAQENAVRGLASTVRVGRYFIRGDSLVSYYFRNYEPNQHNKYLDAALEFMRKSTPPDEEWRE